MVNHWLPVPSTYSGYHMLMAHCQMQEPSTGLHCHVPRCAHLLLHPLWMVLMAFVSRKTMLALWAIHSVSILYHLCDQGWLLC